MQGVAEFDDKPWFDAGIILSANSPIYMGATGVAGIIIEADTDSTQNIMRIMIADEYARSLIIAERDDSAYDFGTSTQTNPTLFIYSANQSQNEYVRFTHDQTDGVIDCGTGSLQLNPGGTATAGDGGTTNYAQFAADGELTLAGTARVKKSVIIPVQDLSVGGTAPDQTILNNFLGYSYDIGDDSVFTTELPPDWASGTDVDIKVDWYINEAYATNNGEVRWQAAWSAVPHDASEAVDSPTHSGTDNSGDVNIPATAKTLTETVVETISGASLSSKDEIGITLSRVAIGGGTDPAADPVVINVYLNYTADKLGAAT